MSAPETDVLPGWRDILAKYGAWTLLVFYLVGAIPFVKSPVDKVSADLTTAIAAHNADALAQLKSNRDVQMDILYTMRAICYRMPQTASQPPCSPRP